MKKQQSKRIDIVSLKLVKEASIHYANRRIESPEDAASILQEFIGDSDREKIAVICMNTKNEPVSISLVSQGSINASIVHPREVYKIALTSNSKAIITGIYLGHNHPSGDPTPSQEDISITKKLAEVGGIIGIEFIDHIILGDNNRFISLKRMKLI